jgi:hypothetical protein
MTPRLTIAAALLAATAPLAARAQIVGNGGVTGTSLQVSTLNTGTTLSVEGAVSADGRYVTLNVDPQFSSLDGIDTFVVPATSTGMTVGGTGLGGGLFIPAGTQALTIRRVPFRPAQIGPVVLINHQDLLLTSRIPAMSLKGISLKDAVQKIATASNKNIVLGIRGLEEDGVNTNSPRNFEIPAGNVKTALLEILKTATGDLPMVITAEERVVTIATQGQADNVVVTRRYYLEDLLANSARWVAGGTNLNALSTKFPVAVRSTDFSKSPRDFYAEEEARASEMPATRPTTRPIVKKPQPRDPAVPVSTSITELITSTVRPEIWKVNGGKVGEIGLAGNVVVIRAPQSVHAILEGPRHFNPDKVPLYVGYGQ